MTPDELALIASDGETVRTDTGSFSVEFYDTLFEIAPSTRELFPEDLVAQRGKLVNELAFLIDAATSSNLTEFAARARDLGRRHVDYGVAGADYAAVGVALVAALRHAVDGWDVTHELAWTKMFRLIADVMREGAETAPGDEIA